MILDCQSQGAKYVLKSPTSLPNAGGFLWNQQMLIQANCRGYAIAQFMQPDAGKYVSGPALEAKTFMQPEQPYYANHPGRFFYIKDNATGELFSAPYEPVRAPLARFEFINEAHQISWLVECQQLRVTLCLRLPTETAIECWQFSVENLSDNARDISVYPYFPIGYRSWMNQSGQYNSELNAVVCRSIEPYQKVADYFKNQSLHELTFLACERSADSWETRQHEFEGEGGLHNPSAIQNTTLANGQANYCTPTAVMQFKLKLNQGQSEKLHFIFGPAKNSEQISKYKKQFLNNAEQTFAQLGEQYQAYLAQGEGVLQVSTPEPEFDAYVNHWMARQLYYHGDVNRLTTDPQTRNYLQDNMGMSYIKPTTTRDAFVRALSQQKSTGEMPDGILLTAGAELKYINQVPHTDHCVWLPICLQAYLDETGDYALLDSLLPFSDSEQLLSVSEHISLAMHWLDKSRDERGLSYINQGDWCDPMNMVGYQGKGVSVWLSLASAYALKLWTQILQEHLGTTKPEMVFFNQQAELMNQAVNQHCWADSWFARGITDAGRVFATQADKEGKIFLNPQSWAWLSGAADARQTGLMLTAIEQQLHTPYGVMMLAPGYTAMVEDIGRVTQKFPGTAENGSVYNHASAFYIYSLYHIGQADLAFEQLLKMLPKQQDMLQRGQLPLFIPNYYRGAYYQFPDEAGKSSQLFNTGTVAWYYRILLEQLFGVRGSKKGLIIKPQLPSHWNTATIQRRFRGALFTIEYQRMVGITEQQVFVDNSPVEAQCISDFSAGNHYQVTVNLPIGLQ
ncbi:GH36-type glycosyl hydrolase domain-containing protein [Paraglaciecola hydrolytica]|uniref:NdvB protein n=1 Tax=Paraglaciecola hydrolytica TaxID=1799789 RepID=A0A148KLQ8_9ALTE|nr:NdvB protein [Paraglaciecola hydrolytica]KXI27199.1 NdvB protein [Paraglaciecola hydrolytica]